MYTRTLLLALTLLLGTAAGASAYPGHQWQRQYQDFASDLTPEQQAQVQQLTDTHHEQLFALNKELETKAKAMEVLFAVFPPDKAALGALLAEINALQIQRTKLNVDYRLNLMEVAGKPVPARTDKGYGPGAGCMGQGSPCPGAASRGPQCGPAGPAPHPVPPGCGPQN
ncbi:hypothetical protein MASR1M90_06850 [Desulfovibrionales bacterium]